MAAMRSWIGISSRSAGRCLIEIRHDGQRIHRAEDVAIYSFAGTFINDLAARMERRVAISFSVTEQHIYLDINGHSLATTIERHRLLERN